MAKKKQIIHSDYLLIGAGIMSATLGTFLQALSPKKHMIILERMSEVAVESSSAWNNAGTGHAAQCELNYTPEKENGDIDIKKAIKINSQFEESKQFWTYLLNNNVLKDQHACLNPIPHMSFVYGQDHVNFLKKRHKAMQAHPFFKTMEYTEETSKMMDWMPLMIKNRDLKTPIAATKIENGCDVNFGAITRGMITNLTDSSDTEVRLNSEVEDIERLDSGLWKTEVKNLKTGEEYLVISRFVFIGAGGGSLPLLEKSDIEAAEGYGGFPVSGQWLVCKNKEIIEKHYAKVYGKAQVGAPPMSVPHLDTRRIDGERSLFFGPFAGFSTKFLKNGSYLDLIKSIEIDNIFPMLAAGWHNMKLTKYLIDQVKMSFEDRMDALRNYYPEAKNEDWELKIAGQRVQVIKKDDEQVGILGFGTEMVTNADGSLAALLGASPGASTATSIMLNMLEKCFPEEYASTEWQEKLNAMVPYRAKKLQAEPELVNEAREVSKRLFA